MLEGFIKKLEENADEKGPFVSKQKVNLPSYELPGKPITTRELDKEFEDRFRRIERELRAGLNFIRKHPRSVTFFGSARLPEDHKYYELAREVGGRIVREGYDVMTGGGPGIMEGANRGAWEEGGPHHSVGFGIDLPSEQVVNPYVDDYVGFYYFFTRKVTMTFSAEAYLFFPGGFGTLDEFFEILTLVQTKKIEKVPLILVGDEYWGKLDDFFKEMLAEKYKTIAPQDRHLYTITEDVDKVIEIIKGAPLREE